MSVPSLQERIAQADSLLAPYAIKHSEGLGRTVQEEEDETRFRFQRDRGRIVHTQEFRRLKGKTQVFVGGGGDDHYRTRLTHTMEVAGISRDIARTLRLNEDLAECIALAHDLGHPPFGHAGEAMLNEWMQKQGSSFEHNEQSHRIVTLLAKHSSLFKGLNVNQEILDGLLKHTTPHDHPRENVVRAPSLEAQLVNLADEISYTAHDCEDGLGAGLFSLDKITKIPLAKKAHAKAEERGTSLRGSIIHLLIEDLYKATESNMLSQRITTLDDVFAAIVPIVSFSEKMHRALDKLRAFLWKNMYEHPLVLKSNQAGQSIIESLCTFYLESPTDKVKESQSKSNSELLEAIKDYVAGMTDSYAFLQAQEHGLLDAETVELLSY